MIDDLTNIIQLAAFLWLGGILFVGVGMFIINALADA